MDRGNAGSCRRDVNLFVSAPTSRLVAWLAPVLVAVGAMLVLSPARATALVHSSIIVDAATGRVLHARNANQRTYPASLTKLMTLYLVFSALEHGKLKLEQPLRVSAHAAAQSPTKLGLRPGSTITVRSAILGIVTLSANDAAVVLGEALGGTERRFARMMDAEARRLGMTRTRFENASGLPNRRQKTTARDMAKLAVALIHTFPRYYHFFSVRKFDFHGRIVRGHDHLLRNYPGCDGLKTGFIRASGYNLVSSAVRHGHRVVGVVLGGRTYARRDREMRHLLNVAFARERRAAAARVRIASRKASRTHDGARDTAEQADSAHRPELMARLGSEADRIRPEDSDRHEERAPVSRDFSVRIGSAFRNVRHARRVVRSAIHTAPHELRGARFEVIHYRRRRHHRYVVRVVDLSEWRARRVCRKLKSRRFRCEVIEPERERSLTASAAE